jgi:hypothetical protein
MIQARVVGALEAGDQPGFARLRMDPELKCWRKLMAAEGSLEWRTDAEPVPYGLSLTALLDAKATAMRTEKGSYGLL